MDVPMRRQRQLAMAIALAGAGVAATLPAGAGPGDPDPGFGEAGVVVVDDDGRTYRANDGAVQADNKIVLAGQVENTDGGTNLRVVRLNRNGERDAAFGDNGEFITDLATDETLNGVVVQDDAKLVAVGRTGSGTSAKPIVVRFNDDGTLDDTFGTAGVLTTLAGNRGGEYTDVGLQSDGAIVATGFIRLHSGDIRILVTRITPSGTIDSTFNGGHVQVTLIGDSTAQGLAIQSDDAIVLAATDASGPETRPAAARLTRDGEHDASFDDDGLLVFEQLIGRGGAVTVQDDGKIVLVGTAVTEGQETPLLVRLDPDGTPDGDFANGGVALVAVQGEARAVAVQTDGRILVAGTINGQVAVARLRPDASFDAPFGEEGVAVILTDFGVATFVGTQSSGRVVLTGFGNEVGGETQSFLAARLENLPPARCGGKEVTVDLRRGDLPTQGDDVIRGTAEQDTIDGLGGSDIICGLAGDDTLSGGAGTDTLIGGTGGDRLRGGPGDDQLRGGRGGDALNGGPGDDACRGGAGRDQLASCEGP
jgi:uncharacterized delta-60 repeat protein